MKPAGLFQETTNNPSIVIRSIVFPNKSECCFHPTLVYKKMFGFNLVKISNYQQATEIWEQRNEEYVCVCRELVQVYMVLNRSYVLYRL